MTYEDHLAWLASLEAPGSAASTLRPVSEAKRLRELIYACPHFTPKAAGDPCGCMGRCSAGKGDLHEGRTSWKNCLECRAVVLDGNGGRSKM